MPLTTIDALLPPEDTVDLIKIDVEGFEDAVLRGMLGLLDRHQPAVFLECNHDGPIQALDAILADLPHHLYHLGPDGPQRVQGFAGDASDEHRNFLLLPPDQADRLDD